MKDFLTFKKMITPMFMQILFWILIALSTAISVDMIIHGTWIRGLLALIFFPIIIRIACEWIIVFFRMHENIIAVRDALNK